MGINAKNITPPDFETELLSYGINEDLDYIFLMTLEYLKLVSLIQMFEIRGVKHISMAAKIKRT